MSVRQQITWLRGRVHLQLEGLLLRVRRSHNGDQNSAQREGDAEDADAALRLAHGRGNRARFRLIGFI